MLVEQFLPGREFTVGILGTGADAEVLGTLEIVAAAGRRAGRLLVRQQRAVRGAGAISRWFGERATSQVAEAERIALAAWRAVGGRDAGRLDLRCDATGSPQLMEINPLAGLHPTHSDLPMLWTAIGREYVELIERIVESAQIADCGLRIADWT